MRRGIDLENVNVATLCNFGARIARAARVGRRALLTVEGAGQDSRRCRLADPARASEHEGLSQPALGERVPQGLRHAALADDVAKVRTHPLVPDSVSVGGFVYDVDTGLLTQHA